jgi:hypothetical protein
MRPSLGYFGNSSFGPTVADPSFFDRLGATFRRDPPKARWAVDDDDDDDSTPSLPTIAEH